MLGAIGVRWLLLVIGLLASTNASAATLVGSPPYSRFTPDLAVIPQNFDIAQDSLGIVYVGNTDGVLEFDGERWSVTPLPNREIVRSLAVDADDRVYVGGYNAFGYLQRDEYGKNQFVDLTVRFAKILNGREFNDIWSTLVAPEGIYFRALRDVFFWKPGSDSIAHWRYEGRFGINIHHQGRTLLQFRGEGIKRREGDEWVLLPETHTLVNLLNSLLPLPDGSLLAFGVDGDWNFLRDGVLEPATMPAQMPAASAFGNATVLADGSIALTSGDGMVYIVDPTRQTEAHFKIDPGWLSGIVASHDGGFLLSGDMAIYRVAWPAPWGVLGDEHGVGSPWHIAQWNGQEYLSSGAGVLRMTTQANGIPKFEDTGWGADVTYALIEVDANRALIATSHKLMQIENDSARPLSEELVYPRNFVRSRFRPGRIYVGTETGLRYVDVTQSGITLSTLANQGLEMWASSIAEISAQELWYGTYRHGLWHVVLGDNGSIASMQRYGAAEGLKLGVIPEASVALLDDGRIMVATHHGFFQLDGDRFVESDVYGLGTLRSAEEKLTLVQAEQGDLWAYSSHRLLRRARDHAWVEQPIRHLKRGAFHNFSLRANGSATFIASQSLLVFDPSQSASPTTPPKATLRSVARVLPDGNEHALPLYSPSPIALQRGDFGVKFQFALPDLAQVGGQMYQGRLVGYEEEFSVWSRARGFTYSRLSPGSYSLQVRARDALGNISEISPYDLIVLPPWYQTFWAYALWILSGCGLLWMITRQVVRRRTYRLAEDKRLLESTVAERTQDLATANERLQQMANLDGLTGIANRRRLDQYLLAVWEQARERQKPVAVIVIDVDHFKRYNDTRGHLAGDQLLKDLVPRLLNCLRRSEDLLARYGGEEFLAILPGADAVVATSVAEAMRSEVHNAQLGATISLGAASWTPNGGNASALVEAADRALYAAKNNGRNQVGFSDSHAPL